MAKCLICNSRKGKRKCIYKNGFICSLCCGESRSFDKCDGCTYYKDTKSIRNYKKVPFFSLSHMSEDFSLQDQANAIESAICKFDDEQNGHLDDNVIKKIIKQLLDRFHFKDEKTAFSNKLEENGFISVDRAIKEDLSSKSSDEIVKLLGTIYRSVLRHNEHRRAYIDFIHEHVGSRIGKGARLIKGLP
ncbi:MAG: hypothetical protein SRB2_04315 [Desulfobacteraceae bacterium Eth-SRB2]|nr:MAG: hypothetical protein SRB2_04315 [Desulfobacteraceae bacterium Eth-SRB2]